ncbi:MAG: hypothetical protein WDO68_04505 [Gammaproteobacteria bacterium]
MTISNRAHSIAAITALGIMAAASIRAAPAQNATTNAECSPVIENRAPCTSTLWTYEPAENDGPPVVAAGTAQASYSPIAVRARRGVTVTVAIHKRPLEQISVVKSYNAQPRPDAVAAIAAQLSKPLAGLTIWTALSALPTAGAADATTETHSFLRAVPSSAVREADQAIEEFKKNLEEIDRQQTAAFNAIRSDIELAPDLTREISEAQVYPPRLEADGSTWSENDRKNFQACVQHILARIHGNTPDEKQNEACGKESPAPSDLRQHSFAPLPSADMADLKTKVSTLSANLEALRKKLTSITSAQRLQLITFSKQVNEIADRQDTLGDLMKSAQTAREAFVAYEGLLPECLQYKNTCSMEEAAKLISYSTKLNRFPPPLDSGSEQVSAKFTAQTVLTNTSSDAGTVAVTWVHQPWEVSTGIMYSNVLGRSFQNSPVIEGGVPQLDASGKQITAVTDSTTKPTIDALILVHYRFYDSAVFRTRRFAILGSVGVGTGTNGSGADFAAGLSFSYGNFFLSPLLHFTRDLRLTNGVALGQNLNGTNPPTERYWVHKFGLAFTYAVPIT